MMRAMLAVLALAPLGVLGQGGLVDVDNDPLPVPKHFALVMSGHEFNGFSHPDSPLLEATEGELLNFYVVVPPTAEPHVFHLHGHPWYDNAQGRFIDAKLLMPGEYHTFNVTAGAAGDWMYHCHFDAHFAGGMWGVLRVHPAAERPDVDLA